MVRFFSFLPTCVQSCCRARHWVSKARNRHFTHISATSLGLVVWVTEAGSVSQLQLWEDGFHIWYCAIVVLVIPGNLQENAWSLNFELWSQFPRIYRVWKTVASLHVGRAGLHPIFFSCCLSLNSGFVHEQTASLCSLFFFLISSGTECCCLLHLPTVSTRPILPFHNVINTCHKLYSPEAALVAFCNVVWANTVTLASRLAKMSNFTHQAPYICQPSNIYAGS